MGENKFEHTGIFLNLSLIRVVRYLGRFVGILLSNLEAEHKLTTGMAPGNNNNNLLGLAT